MKKFYLLIFLMLVQSVYSIELTLEDAINRSYEKDLSLKNSRLDIKNSNLNNRIAIKEGLPKLDYNGSYKVDEKNNYGNSDRDKSYSHSINLSQPLYKGGQILTGISIAKLNEEKNQYQLLDKKSSVRLSVIERYTEILSLYETLDVYKVSLKELQEEYKKTNRKYELDMVSKSKLLPLNTKIINTKTSILELQNQIKIAKVKLRNQLKLPGNTSIELVNIDFIQHKLDSFNLESDVKYVRENNRNVKISEIDYQVLKSQETLTKANFLPEITANGGYTSEGGSFSSYEDNWDWSVGVTIKMNIFSFGQDMDRYNVATNNTKKGANNLEQTKDNTEVDLRSKFLELVKYDGTIKEQEAAVISAKENYALESKRYEQGLTDIVDFLTIENALRTAEVNLIKAKLNYYLAYEKYMDTFN